MFDSSSSPAYTDGDIIARQMAPFEGGGMKVKAYGRNPTRCPLCGAGFNYKFECPTHSFVRPKRIRVQISGVDNERGFVQVYSDFEGKPLSFMNAGMFMKELERRIALGTFEVRDLRPEERNRHLVREYAKYYLSELKVRTELPPGSRKWLSKSAFTEYEKYTRLYIVPTLGDWSIKDFTKERQIENWLDELVDQSGLPASNTIQRKASGTLRHMLNFAARKNDRNTLEFSFPNVSRQKRKLVTASVDVQLRIIEYFEQHYAHAAPLIKWTAAKPHRTNENRAFRIRDFNFESGTYRLNGSFDAETYKPFPKIAEKSGAEFEMGDEDMGIIRSALKDRIVQPDDYIFINPKTGKAFTHYSLDGMFNHARKATGHTDITLEQFGRHSWVKQRLDEGWDFTRISHYTLNDVATLQKFYANVTVSNRKKVTYLRTNPGLKKQAPQNT